MPLELGARLIAAGLVVPDEVEAALFMSVLRGISFARALIDRGAITERDLNEELDKNGDLPATYVEVDLALFEALPVGLCRRLAVVPLRRDDESGTVDAAAVDPLDPHLPMELAFHLSSPIRVFRASLSAVEDALRRAELGAPGAGTRSTRLNRPTPASLYGAPDSVGGYPASVPLPLTRKIENPDDVIPSGELAPMSEEEEEEATMVRSLPSLPDPISEPATEPEPVLPLLAAKIIPSRAPPPMPPAEAAPPEAPPWGGHEGMGPMTKPSSMMGSPASTRGGSLSLGVPNVPIPNVARSYGISGAGEAPPSSRGSFRAAPVSSRRTPIYLTPPPEAPISFPTPPPDDEDVISVKDDEIFAMDDADADRVSEREPPPPARESAPEVSLRARPPTLRSPILFPPPPPSDEGRISDLPTGPWVAKKVLSTAPDSAPTMALPSPRNEEPRSEPPKEPEEPSNLDEEVDSAPTLVRDSLDLSESDATVAVSSPSPGARAWPALRPPAAGMPPPPVPSAAMPSPLPGRPPAGAEPAFRPPVAAPPVSSGPDSAPTMAISLPESSMVSTPLVRPPVSSSPSGGSYVMPPPPVGATTLDPGTITMSAPMELPPPPIPAELSAREMPEPQSAGVVMTTPEVPANPPPPPDPWAPEPLRGAPGADPWAPEPLRGAPGADPWAPEPLKGAPGANPWSPEPLKGAAASFAKGPGGLKDATWDSPDAKMTLKSPTGAAAPAPAPAPRGEPDRPPESSQTLAFTAEAPEQPAGVPVLGAGSAPPESSPTLMGIGESLRNLIQPPRPAPAAAPTLAPTAPVAPEPSPPEARVTQPSPQPAPEARAPRQSIPPPAAEARPPRQSIPPPAGEARPPRPSVPPPGAEARTPRPSVPPPAGAASPRPSVPPPALAAALRPSVPPPSLFPPDASPVLASLREAKTRDEVVDLALQGLAPIARRAAVFAVRKDSFRGWACSPSFGDQAAFRDVVIPQDQPSLLATAAAQTVYLGPLAPTPAHAPLAAMMGPGSDDVAAVAARVGGRPALILFADDLTDTLLATRRMDELARAVGDALTRLIGQRG